MTIRCIVVVHGIGTQREHETVVPVICRLAEARYEGNVGIDDVLTLGMAAGQRRRAGDAFTQFEGVPSQGTTKEPFLGLASEAPDAGDLCFVDIHWASLLERDGERVAQSVGAWSAGTLGRLERRTPAPPRWTKEILRLLSKTLGVVETALGWYHKELASTIFQDYLADVQVYGEHAPTRGRAVRRFHDRMNHVHDNLRQNFPGEEIEYTVIAHSLGTVMAFDALMYAHAPKGVRSGARHASRVLPFRGYLETPTDPPPDTDWIADVRSFVTLGSPIDKYLFLWWFNYTHLTKADWLHRDAPRIRHFNYCEEQDPVGHNLDLVRGAPAYQAVFEMAEDRVYTRSAIPGAAHVAYWKDAALFRWILHRAVDPTQPAREPKWFDGGVYRTILRVTYLVLPVVFAFVTWGILMWTWKAEEISTTLLGSAVFVLLAWVGKRLVDLMIWWRQLSGAKRRSATRTLERGDEATAELLDQSALRRRQGLSFRIRHLACCAVFFAATACLSWLYVATPHEIWDSGWQYLLGHGLETLVMFVAIPVFTVLWTLLIRAKCEVWSETMKDPRTEKPSARPAARAWLRRAALVREDAVSTARDFTRYRFSRTVMRSLLVTVLAMVVGIGLPAVVHLDWEWGDMVWGGFLQMRSTLQDDWADALLHGLALSGSLTFWLVYAYIRFSSVRKKLGLAGDVRMRFDEYFPPDEGDEDSSETEDRPSEPGDSPAE